MLYVIFIPLIEALLFLRVFSIARISRVFHDCIQRARVSKILAAMQRSLIFQIYRCIAGDRVTMINLTLALSKSKPHMIVLLKMLLLLLLLLLCGSLNKKSKQEIGT